MEIRKFWISWKNNQIKVSCNWFKKLFNSNKFFATKMQVCFTYDLDICAKGQAVETLYSEYFRLFSTLTFCRWAEGQTITSRLSYKLTGQGPSLMRLMMLGFLLGGAPPGNGPSMKTKVVTNLEGQKINLCNCVTELKKGGMNISFTLSTSSVIIF